MKLYTLLCLFSAVFLFQNLSAQTLTGTVTDIGGVPVANARVTIFLADTTSFYETRTDGLWGVYRTKRGYGGELRRYAGVWVRPISRLRWRLFEMARKRRRVQLG